jgi:hypothetical protein
MQCEGHNFFFKIQGQNIYMEKTALQVIVCPLHVFVLRCQILTYFIKQQQRMKRPM